MKPRFLPSGLLFTPSSNAVIPGIFVRSSRNARVTCAICSGVAPFLYLKTTTWRTGWDFCSSADMGVVVAEKKVETSAAASRTRRTTFDIEPS